jgi:hypothetical protein
MNREKQKFPTVKDVQIIERRGPWSTKSGGELNVLFGLPFDQLKDQYFDYETAELLKIHEDVRGLRAYFVSKLPKDAIGANEWHRIRNELVFALNGPVEWTFEDFYAEKETIVLDENNGVWIPNFILHSYKA